MAKCFLLWFRHPFERILSAYRDKFFINTNYDDAYERRKVKKFFNLFGRKIIQKYRKVQPIDQKYENAPTFREFVHYLLDIPLKGFNSHWLPIYQKCKPCHINYSIIGRIDTMPEDSEE